MNDTTAHPKVSVAIPTYNYGRFLANAIDSVLEQTYGNFELVVSDNSSTDDTRVIAENYARKDTRVRYFLNDRNVGMIGNWNLCLERSSGEYIKILCADDILEPTCLQKSVAALDNHPEAALVCTARTLIDENLKPIGSLGYSDRFESLDGQSVIRECLLNGNRIGEPTAVLFRSNFAKRGFLLSYNQLPDLEMWFQILEKGIFLAIPESLCRIRQHEGQETKSNIRSLAFVDDEFMIFNTYVRKPYIKCTFFEKQRYMYDRALQLWSVHYDGTDLDTIHRRMSRHYNPYAFHFLHFLHMIKLAYQARNRVRK